MLLTKWITNVDHGTGPRTEIHKRDTDFYIYEDEVKNL